MSWNRSTCFLVIAFNCLFNNYAFGFFETGRYFNDATLRSVQFIDKNEGWAVGDQGVIWHTIDGGDYWERQPSGSEASLRSVHFLNPNVGWTVGVEIQPGLGSVGVVLFTKDGGNKWSRVLADTFPGLTCVAFSSPQNGFLVGECREGFGSGIFQTIDGGKSWTPVDGKGNGCWRSIGFTPKKVPFFCGDSGQLAMLLDGKIIPLKVSSELKGDFRILDFMEQECTVAGKGGVIYQSDSSSAFTSWNKPRTTISTELLECMQIFCGVSSGENRILAGYPGSIILKRDKNQVWNAVKVDNLASLHAMAVVHEKKIIAVGEYGLVMKSQDAGETWKVIQQGAKKSRVLLFSSKVSNFQPELASLLGFEEGQILRTSALGHTDPNQQSDSIWDIRMDLAGRVSGSTSSILIGNYPEKSLEEGDPLKLVSYWDSLHEGMAADKLVRELVLLIQTSRPDVVVYSENLEDFSSCRSQTIFHALLTAIEKAKSQDSRILEESGLAKQDAKRFFIPETLNKSSIKLDLVTPSPVLQLPLFDASLNARQIIQKSPKLNQLNFRLAGAAGGGKRFLDGLAPAVIGLNCRELPQFESISKDIIQAYQGANLLRQLSDPSIQENGSSGVMLAGMNSIVEKLPDEKAAVTLMGIANNFHQAGNWAHSREVHKQIIANYPASKQASESMVWMIVHDASSEVRRRHELGQFIAKSESKIGIPGAGNLKVETPRDIFATENKDQDKSVKNKSVKIPEIPKVENQTAGEKKVLANSMESKAWLQNSISISEKFQFYGPLAQRNPNVLFASNSAKRNLGLTEGTAEAFQEFLGKKPSESWRQNVLTENWLVERKGLCPKKNFICSKKAIRPLVDGDLGDSCWEGIPFNSVNHNKGNENSLLKFKFFYDDQFLFIGLTCADVNHEIRPVKGEFLRDKMLPFMDRVVIRLDMDRDYTTAYQFEIGADGSALDSCWNDNSWNPAWFFKVKELENSWNAEIAIPWSSLVGSPITNGKSWAVNVGRISPVHGFVFWSENSLKKNAMPGLEDSGLMFFQAGENPLMKVPSTEKKP